MRAAVARFVGARYRWRYYFNNRDVPDDLFIELFNLGGLLVSLVTTDLITHLKITIMQ
jgi:hypothetical protein